ncbi:MAG: MFS transporter [Gammaproteobacteria bacterium]|nr:MFS transporter [Gammaproteobacteria bacterium]
MHVEAIAESRRRGSARVVGLVSAGHFFSHFYMLLLPPLFPFLRDVYGVGFTELGFAITVFSITTGLTQAPIGFLVDRYGARGILIGGLALHALAMALVAAVPVYPALIAFMVLAGLANAVYHPADYSILNACVGKSGIGRAFSIHTFAGYLGGAMAPVTVVLLMNSLGWRAAVALSAAAGIVVVVLLALNASVLDDAGRDAPGARVAVPGGGLKLLFSVPILTGLLFFTGISMAGHGISDFGVSALHLLHQAPHAQAAAVLSAFLFASPVGVLVGGWIADHTRHHDRLAALCFVTMAAMFIPVGLFDLSVQTIVVMFVIAGLANGLVAPSRDMMIRAVTPPGQMGKVFGFVSTGYNVGGVVAPIVFGYVLDHAAPSMLFWLVGVISLATVVTVFATGRHGRAG